MMIFLCDKKFSFGRVLNRKNFLRNGQGMWKICMVLVLSVLASFLGEGMTVFADTKLDMYSGSYALMDADTGRVLAGKKETEAMANASTTKILTCIVALESGKLEEIAEVSANAASQPKVRLGVKEGEKYPLKDMLYALMLESFNDCAVVIAEHVAGSEEKFAELLNQKAEEIGCQDTYFISPNGLDRENESGFHHTTAEDLCRIMAYCVWESPMKEDFLLITQTDSYSGNANGRNYTFQNHNLFLDQMEGVLSGKTGYTNKAGYCYVAALEQEGERYCIALLACGWPNNKNYKWHDAKELFTYGLENYEIRTVELENLEETFELEGYVGEPQFSFLNQNMKLVASAKGKEYKVLLNSEENLRAELELCTDVELPVAKGQELGVCRVYLEDMEIDSIVLIAEDSSQKWTFGEIIKIIFGKYIGFSS